MVFGAEVFNVSTSVWVTGCSVGSVAVVWRFVDGCGCSVCGMGVAWVVGWAVVGTWSSATWHEPSAGGSFLSLFLGGICGCPFELTNGGRQCWVSTAVRLSSTNECGMKRVGMTT
jgi:hypothetical protein